MYIKRKTLDDLLRAVLSHLLNSKNRISPSRGKATESIGVLLEITDPRARLSLSERRSRFASCLGELLWYLAGTKNLSYISYYLSRYGEESEDGRTVYGGYGPRLFGGRINQVGNVIRLLKKRDSRRAVIQLFDAVDIDKKHRDVPCTCTLQFMVRSGQLHLIASMRSNDAFIGLPHDVFAFTMIQEIMARTVGVELGTYKHAVGSLHLYESDRPGARQYLNEGWQSTSPMPPMPNSSPWNAIKVVLRAEHMIRHGKDIRCGRLSLKPYWKDFVRLLQIYREFRNRQDVNILRIKSAMSTPLYDSYIEDLRNRLRTTSTRKKY